MLMEDVVEHERYLLTGLKSRPDLNGVEVTVLLTFEERVCVELPSGEGIRVKPTNLQALATDAGDASDSSSCAEATDLAADAEPSKADKAAAAVSEALTSTLCALATLSGAIVGALEAKLSPLTSLKLVGKVASAA